MKWMHVHAVVNYAIKRQSDEISYSVTFISNMCGRIPILERRKINDCQIYLTKTKDVFWNIHFDKNNGFCTKK
jgi:hypothetical protein